MISHKINEIELFVGHENIKRFDFPKEDKRQKPVSVYHLYPTLYDWRGKQISDRPNPRSHNDNCLKTPLAKEIQKTILESPETFQYANRGCTIIAESLNFDNKTGMVKIRLSDPEWHGEIDGATSDACIADIWDESIKEQLQKARFHVEVITNYEDKDGMEKIVLAKNTSRQLKGWSLSDYEGNYDFLKEIVEDESSPIKGKIAYEENGAKDINILDVLALLTLFSPEFKDSDTAPVIAYSGKGKLDARLRNLEYISGYKKLVPILIDILELHDYVYSGLEIHYNNYHGEKGSKLGRRKGITSSKMGSPLKLPFTDLTSNYVIPKAYLFVLLSGFRALVRFPIDGSEAVWKTDPKKFYDSHGDSLVKHLFELCDAHMGNPNRTGKSPLSYTAMLTKAQNLLED